VIASIILFDGIQISLFVGSDTEVNGAVAIAVVDGIRGDRKWNHVATGSLKGTRDDDYHTKFAQICSFFKKLVDSKQNAMKNDGQNHQMDAGKLKISGI